MWNDNITHHINLIQMWSHFKNNENGFWQGFIGGAMVCAIPILRIDFHLPELAEWVMRLISIAGAGIFVGLMKVIGEDVGKKIMPYLWRVYYWFKDNLWRLKNKLFKSKNKHNGTGSDKYKQNGRAA